jgi:hypothetical protein
MAVTFRYGAGDQVAKAFIVPGPPFPRPRCHRDHLAPKVNQTRPRCSVTVAVALQQPVGHELSQVVAELVEAVDFVGEVEGRQDGMVDFLRGPTADLSAATQKDFEKADDARGPTSMLLKMKYTP